MNIWLFVLVFVGVLVLLIIGIYNKLVTLKNRAEEAWSDIDVQLKRRYDLIPNLIETVKGYATHEEGTLMKVIAARNSAMQTHDSASATLEAKAASETALSSTLKSIFALSESYPDLKANTNFLKLQDELSDTENKIQASRRFFNSVIQEFNTAIEVFPNTIIAGPLGFKKREFFQIENPAEKENIKVAF